MSPASLRSSEIDLLLCCARARIDESAAQRARSLAANDFDWPALAAAAEWHGVLPLVLKHLSETCADAVPAPALEELRARLRDSTYRSLALTRELLSLSETFAAAGVLAVPFKGPMLAAQLYGDAGLRQCGDLDFLIGERDIRAASALLTRQGYRGDLTLTAAETRLVARYGCELVFRRGDSVVELHWKLAPEYFVLPWRLEDVRPRLGRARLGGLEIPTLAAEDLLFALCVHGTKDAWQRLVWIADVARLAQVAAIDWTRFLSMAIARGCRRLVLAPLWAARNLLGFEPPGPVADAVAADPGAASLASDIRTCVFRDSLTRMSGPAESRFHLKARDRLSDRLRYTSRLAFTPTLDDCRFLPLTAASAPLRFLVRPVRLLLKYGGAS